MAKIKVDDRKYWVLLALDAAHGKPLTPVQLQKSLFLLSEKNNLKNAYKFKPYDYGPFAPEVYRDAEELESDSLIDVSYEQNFKWKVYKITEEGKALSEKIKESLPDSLINSINDVIDHVLSLDFRELVQEIYKDYPKYSVNTVFRE